MKFSRDSNTAWGFKGIYRCFSRYTILPKVVVGRANPYRKVGIYAELSRIPEGERSSAGCMWFSQKCNIPSGGIGPEKWFADESNMHADGAENELSWDCPFWDMERVIEWGVVMSWSAGSSQPHVWIAYRKQYGWTSLLRRFYEQLFVSFLISWVRDLTGDPQPRGFCLRYIVLGTKRMTIYHPPNSKLISSHRVTINSQNQRSP